MTTKVLEVIEDVTNDAAFGLAIEEPYTALVEVQGTAPLLFHRWSCDDVEEKAKKKKGSLARKTDNVESYVIRNATGEICIPGDYFRGAIVNAGRYMQDPRSPRKSAMELFKASIVINDELCSLGSKDWDYLDRRRVVIQKAGITRQRPAFNVGWRAKFSVQALLADYVPPQTLHQVLGNAGRFSGVGDFRPTFGRFCVIRFEVQS